MKSGIYHEKLLIPSWKTHITVVGQNVDGTVITFYTARWDASGFASGIYFYQFRAMKVGSGDTGGLSQTKKMILLK